VIDTDIMDEFHRAAAKVIAELIERYGLTAYVLIAANERDITFTSNLTEISRRDLIAEAQETFDDGDEPCDAQVMILQ